MRTLFHQRLTKHVIEMTKYLRYVLNDFFLLALIFFIGGLGLSYSNLLKTLTSDLWWSRPLNIVIILIGLQIGGLATLVQRADFVFLIPRELDLRSYLSAAFRYSVSMAMLPQALIWFVLIPLLKTTQTISNFELVALLIEMGLLKGLLVRFRLFNAYQMKQQLFSNQWLCRYLLPLVILAVGFYTQLWAGLIVVTALVWGLSELAFKRQQIGPLNWNHLIDTEDHRMHRIYQFFNMFTDVPQLAGQIHRRKYLTPLLNRLNRQNANPYLYLYLRGIVRDTETSGLYLRLTIIGIVIMACLNGIWLPLIINVLFIYLIGFQLIPFYFHFSNNVFTHLYPLQRSIQIKSFQRVMIGLLMTTSVLFAIASIFGTHLIWLALIILIVGGLESYFLVQMYLPSRIKKEIKSL